MPADLRMKPESLKLAAHAAFFIVQFSVFYAARPANPVAASDGRGLVLMSPAANRS